MRSAGQLRVIYDRICSQLSPQSQSSLFLISCLESRQSSFEEAAHRIVTRKAEVVIRQQISDQYQSLKLKSATLDTTKVAALSKCLEDLEAKRQKLLLELSQVESAIQARKLEKEQAMAMVQQEREDIKSEFSKQQSMKNQLTPGSDVDDQSLLDTVERFTDLAVKCIDDLLAKLS
jgi:valyl-tRNA synthetase